MMRLLRRATSVTSTAVYPQRSVMPSLSDPMKPERRVGPRPTEQPHAEPTALPPTYEPGICWHAAHVELAGVRYGVTPAPTHDASGLLLWAALTRCHHRSPGGDR